MELAVSLGPARRRKSSGRTSADCELPAEDDEDPRDESKDGVYGPESSEAEPHKRFKTLYQEPDAQKEHAKILRESHGCAPCLRVEDGSYCKLQGWQPSNGSRLSCGRNVRWRKAVEPQKKRLGGEATQLLPNW